MIVMQRVHLKYRLDRKRYLMVMQLVQLKYRIEREISECNAKSAIEVQARERYI